MGHCSDSGWKCHCFSSPDTSKGTHHLVEMRGRSEGGEGLLEAGCHVYESLIGVSSWIHSSDGRYKGWLTSVFAIRLLNQSLQDKAQ